MIGAWKRQAMEGMANLFDAAIRRRRLAARRKLRSCTHGPGEPQSTGLAVVEHDGCRLLCRGLGGRHGQLRQAGIFNTDQGRQFTGFAFTSVLRKTEVRLSMDGRGRWMASVCIERL